MKQGDARLNEILRNLGCNICYFATVLLVHNLHQVTQNKTWNVGFTYIHLCIFITVSYSPSYKMDKSASSHSCFVF